MLFCEGRQRLQISGERYDILKDGDGIIPYSCEVEMGAQAQVSLPHDDFLKYNTGPRFLHRDIV